MQEAFGKFHREGISVMELADMFPDEDAAAKWFEAILWPDGRFCLRCGCTETSIAAETSGLPYYCSGCQRSFSVKIGTALQQSKIPLRKWVFAIYLEMTNLKGVSSMKLYRDIKATQKTAWFMLHWIREAFAHDLASFAGPVEVDETFFGGKRKTMPNAQRKELTGRGGVGKSIVLGTKDRETSYVTAKVIPSTDSDTLQGFIKDTAAEDAEVYTDDHRGYTHARPGRFKVTFSSTNSSVTRSSFPISLPIGTRNEYRAGDEFTDWEWRTSRQNSGRWQNGVGGTNSIGFAGGVLGENIIKVRPKAGAHIWSNRDAHNPQRGPGDLVVQLLSSPIISGFRVATTDSAYFLFMGGKGCTTVNEWGEIDGSVQ